MAFHDDALVTFTEVRKHSDISYSRNQLFTMFSMYLRIIKVMIYRNYLIAVKADQLEYTAPKDFVLARALINYVTSVIRLNGLTTNMLHNSYLAR